MNLVVDTKRLKWNGTLQNFIEYNILCCGFVVVLARVVVIVSDSDEARSVAGLCASACMSSLVRMCAHGDMSVVRQMK